MKPTRTISSYVLLVGLLGLAIVGGILAYQIYSAAVKSQATTEQKQAIKPIDGGIKESVINNLKQRDVYDENEMNNALSNVSPVETTSENSATISASPTTMETATNTATTQ